MNTTNGHRLRAAIAMRDIIPFIGVYDVFSATLSAKQFDGLFISGFSFAASHYGLPDIGFIAWPDIVAFTQRVRAVLPETHIIVDIDDGYGDENIAAHTVLVLEPAGASGIILEDQKRPRRCGHSKGKQLLDLDEFLVKLEKVLAVRKDLVVVARTDATDNADRLRRVKAFEQVGADAVLVDGLDDLRLLSRLSGQINIPLMFNQIAGGKSPPCSLTELKQLGVSLVNYSTPCLFGAQEAIEQAMMNIKQADGRLPDAADGHVDLSQCTAVLNGNLARQDNAYK